MSTRKMGIRRRFLLLLFSAVLLSFAVLSAVLFHSMYRVQDNAVESGQRVGEAAGEFTEALAENHAKQKLLIDVTENAHHADREIADIAENVKYIALDASKILSHPESYLPRSVKIPRRDTIHSGECYIVFGADVRRSEAWPEIRAESHIASNIADTLEHLSIYYSNYATSCFITSENNYVLIAESFEDEELVLPESFEETYNPKGKYYWDSLKANDFHTQIYKDSGGYYGVMCSIPYYVGGKVAGVAGIGIGMASLYHDITSKTVGDSGINFALNQDGVVVFSSVPEGPLATSPGKTDLRRSENGALALAAKNMTEGNMGVVPLTLNGEEYYLAYAPMPVFHWSLGSLARKDEVVNGVQAAKDDVLGLSQGLTASIQKYYLGTFRQMAVFMAVIFILVFFLSQAVANHMVRPLLALTGGVGKIAGGDLDAKLDVRTGDELEELSDSINQMTDDLKLYIENLSKITAEKEQIRTELSLCQGIQEGMLPDIFPRFAGNPHYDLFATMEAAREVGGDFYDFYSLGDDRLAVTIADVSGKGIPAAMFMVISKTILKNIALAAAGRHGAAAVDWGRAMERANRQLCENNEEMMFVTVFFGILDLTTGEFTYVNGGHNPPLVGRARGGAADWRYLRDEKKTHMVGVIEEAQYEEKRLTLRPGDTLYFYTDGVTEAMDAEKRLYTEERLRETLNRVGTPAAGVKDILAAVRADVDSHAAGAEQSDDITMLGIRFLG
ncbi:MAG: SpoIIE family protein phosphatase [Schwartzia sp.]|nr:SpoIIE family protein phosphatase [Schwartzia sp. (in: firmicutes)]